MLQRTTTLLDSVKDIDMPVSCHPVVMPFEVDDDDADVARAQRDKWIRTILPIGVLFSGSLILSNYAYLT